MKPGLVPVTERGVPLEGMYWIYDKNKIVPVSPFMDVALKRKMLIRVRVF